MAMTNHVFAYGTLKTGQCRCQCWPTAPLAVTPAWTNGRLYDTGPYPALIDGDDRVLGELWCFDDAHIDLVLQELDKVEGCKQLGEPNQYDRVVVPTFSMEGRQRRAFVYRYAIPSQVERFRYIVPSTMFGGQLCALWPDAGTDLELARFAFERGG
jgi:gamma-glutamylcyclotransferase (GGCT)/AIG2-like uncharacterized protein YtfP